MLSVAAPFLEQEVHPTVVIAAYRQALEDMVEIVRDQVSIEVDINNREQMTKIVKSCVGTKFIAKW